MSDDEVVLDFSDIAPYPFMMSDEKGKKAAVRFRENIRRYYPNLKLSKGLTIKDEPILQLFCYDQQTEIAYCRIYSKTHDGPMFANVADLYNAYNLSTQGHPEDVFQYAGTDSDRGLKLGEFLKQNEIRNASELTPEELQRFELAVSKNPMKLEYENAYTAKQKKKSEDQKKKAAMENPNSECIPIVSEEEQVNKKKPGRPKGSKTSANASTNKRPRPTSPVNNIESTTPIKQIKTSTVIPSPNNGNLVFPLMNNIEIDLANIDNSTALFQFPSQSVRLADLPQDSIARQAMMWRIFSQMIAKPNSFVDPTNDPESLLRNIMQENNQSVEANDENQK